MNPEIVNSAAQSANQVGLLTWVVVAVMIFCGSIILIVLFQNQKREERYANLVQIHLTGLESKFTEHKSTIDEANRMQKYEHGEFLKSLNKNTETLVALAAIIQGRLKLPKEA